MAERPMGNAKVTVLLSSGLYYEHVYVLPHDRAEWEKILTDLIDKMLRVGQDTLLTLISPAATYHPQHVVGIRLEVAGPPEIEEIVKAANEKLGYQVPGS